MLFKNAIKVEEITKEIRNILKDRKKNSRLQKWMRVCLSTPEECPQRIQQTTATTNT